MAPTVRYDLDPAHVETLTDAYQRTWFGEDWDRETVDGILDGTDAVVALCDPDGDELLAFAHAISDHTTAAFVRDVVVREGHRGRGLGRRLVTELREHPALDGVDTLSVTCPERLAAFYETCGFERREDGVVLVEGE